MRGAGKVEVGMGDRRVERVEQVALVGEAVERADGFEDPSVVGTHPFEQHSDPPSFELGDDLAQRLGAGGVERLHLGEAQDHHPHVADRGELGEEALRGAEEQRPVDAVDDDVLGKQPGLVGAVEQFVGGQRLALCLAVQRDLPQRQQGGDGDADLDGDDEIERDRGDRGSHEHQRIRARRAGHGPDVVHLDHATCRDHQDAGERGERDLRHQATGEEHHEHEHDGVAGGGDPGASAGPHVDGGAGDRPGRWHPPEQRRSEVGETLAE